MAKMADFRSHTSGGSACGSRATGIEKNGNKMLMKSFLQILQTFTLKNKGASRCHRRTFLSKWFHKEPLTSEKPLFHRTFDWMVLCGTGLEIVLKVELLRGHLNFPTLTYLIFGSYSLDTVLLHKTTTNNPCTLNLKKSIYFVSWSWATSFLNWTEKTFQKMDSIWIYRYLNSKLDFGRYLISPSLYKWTNMSKKELKLFFFWGRNWKRLRYVLLSK